MAKTRLVTAGFEDGGRGREPRDAGSPSKLELEGNVFFPGASGKGHGPASISISVQRDPCQTSGL